MQKGAALRPRPWILPQLRRLLPHRGILASPPTAHAQRIGSASDKGAAPAAPTAAKLKGMAGGNSFLNQNVVHLHPDHAFCPVDTDPQRSLRSKRERELENKLKALRSRPRGLGEDEMSHEERRTILAARREAEEVGEVGRYWQPRLPFAFCFFSVPLSVLRLSASLLLYPSFAAVSVAAGHVAKGHGRHL